MTKRHVIAFILIFSTITVVPLIIMLLNYVMVFNTNDAILTKLFDEMKE